MGVDPSRSRKRMVEEQLVARGINDERVLTAMGEVKRHLFVEEALQSQAYNDHPLPIGEGQTISQPYIVALMSQLLEVKPGARVLEIGTGSGYQSAVLVAMGAAVFTVERIAALHAQAKKRFASLGLGRIQAKLDDGTLGWPEKGPFDRILVTAGGPEVPSPLLDQLEDGGILLMPVGERRRSQRLIRVRREGDHFTRNELESVVFVDLVGRHGWS